MGQVYRATDTALAREVAIKILPPDVARAADRLKRFEVEAKAAGALNHPNILDIGVAKLTNPLGEFGADPESETMRLDTHPGVVLGTAGYMSPEQVRGEV